MIALVTACVLATAPLATEEEQSRWRFAGLPFANYTSDTGLGVGGRGAAYLRAPERTLYLLSFDTQVYVTTGGARTVSATVDAPDVGPASLRLVARGGYTRNSAAGYYGLDADGVPVVDSPAMRIDESTASTHLAVRVPIGKSLSGFVAHRLGFTTARAAPDSLFAEEQPPGWRGNRYSELAAGALLDTRDHEGMPTRGVYAELSVRAASPWIASESTTASAFGSVAAFFSVHERLVLAVRGVVDRQWGAVPYQRRRDFGSYVQLSGLGGAGNLRGLLQDESVGPIKALANAEARIRLLTARPFDVPTALNLAVFSDAGRAWPDTDSWLEQPARVHVGYGAGVRVILQEYFVVRVDVARSGDRTRFYLQFGEVF